MGSVYKIIKIYFKTHSYLLFQIWQKSFLDPTSPGITLSTFGDLPLANGWYICLANRQRKQSGIVMLDGLRWHHKWCVKYTSYDILIVSVHLADRTRMPYFE